MVGPAHFVACGSVGCGTEGDARARYAVVYIGEPGIAIGFRSVTYDLQSVVEDMTAAGLPIDLLREPPAVHPNVAVEASRGRVAAAVSDRVADGPAAPDGVEWLPSTEVPSRVVRLSGVPAGSRDRTLLVGNPSDLEALVEIPRGSRNKYELDEATGRLRLDRRPFGRGRRLLPRLGRRAGIVAGITGIVAVGGGLLRFVRAGPIRVDLLDLRQRRRRVVEDAIDEVVVRLGLEGVLCRDDEVRHRRERVDVHSGANGP